MLDAYIFFLALLKATIRTAHIEAVWRIILFTWCTNMRVPLWRFLFVFCSIDDSKGSKICKWSPPISLNSAPRSMVVRIRFVQNSGKWFFLNLRLDSKEFAAFLRVSKHFEKMIRSQAFDVKRVCKVGKPCLFTSCVGDPRVGRAIFLKLAPSATFW